MTAGIGIVTKPRVSRETNAPRPGSVGGRGQMVTGLASCGWLVEIVLISERESDSRYFAVGTREAHDAEETILRFPGIIREDKRSARRRLSDVEIAFLSLREGGMKPYPPRSRSG
jgi:hypothetical protein